MTTSKYLLAIELDLPGKDPRALTSYHHNWKRIDRKQYDTIAHVRLLFPIFRVRRKLVKLGNPRVRMYNQRRNL